MGLNEDLLVKNDPETKKLIVYSDRTDQGGSYKETAPLKAKFNELGFTYRGDLKAYACDYKSESEAKDKLKRINSFIKVHNKSRDIIEDLEQLEKFIKNQDIDPSKESLIASKLEQYVKDLANATDEKALSQEIRNYLEFFSKFHNYSWSNALLIRIQKRNATKVAGYNKWKELGRGVVKGATQILIWYPMSKKIEDTEPGEDDAQEVDDAVKNKKIIKGFRLGSVYDISDTYKLQGGSDIPEVPKWYSDSDESDIAEELLVRIRKFAESLNIKLTKSDSTKGEKGYSAGGHINISSDVTGVAEVGTLIHEIAHELMHHKGKSPFYSDNPDLHTREIMELQAESVSFVVLKHYDLPVGHQATYNALWKANSEKIMANLQYITKCANYIIKGIDSKGDNEEKKQELKEINKLKRIAGII